VPWARFFIARGRALAAYVRGMRDRATLRQLQHVRDEAARAGFKAVSFDLEQALATA
jgi:hypothetical protein